MDDGRWTMDDGPWTMAKQVGAGLVPALKMVIMTINGAMECWKNDRRRGEGLFARDGAMEYKKII